MLARTVSSEVEGGDVEFEAVLTECRFDPDLSVGAVQLAEAAHHLCEAARAGDLEDGRRLQEEVERSFEVTRSALAPRSAQVNAPRLKPGPPPLAR